MKRIALCLTFTCLMATAGFAQDAKAPLDPEKVYDAFNKLCVDSFGAEKEELTYEAFGKDNKVRDGSQWFHASLNSACVAWQTQLPSKAFVEYGPDTSYGQKTEPHERHFYTHVHYLKGLEPGTTYHYRTVIIDERGQKVEGADATFTTLTEDKVSKLQGGQRAEAVVIDKPGHYVLTADVTSDTTGIEIKTGDVTLDLNGHTVVYDNKKMGPIDGGFPKWFSESASGIRMAEYNKKDVRILNGTVRQGAGGDGAQQNAYGFSPLALQSGKGKSEVAGLTLEYYGTQITGIQQRGSEADIHHNIIVDKGTEITNRHQGCAAVTGTPKVHHNLIKRARHRGIDVRSGSEITHNEINVDSCATNSFAVSLYRKNDALVRHNLIFGSGYLVVGVATVSSTSDVKILDNFIHLQATKPSAAWAEYGEQSGAYCARVTWGGENILYDRNYMITKGRDEGMVRGVWVYPQDSAKNVVFQNNVIKAIAENKATTLRGAIVITGDWKSENPPPTIFRDNRVISNFCNVLIGEDYGIGKNAMLVGNTFVKAGPARDDYRTIQIGFWDKDTFGHKFIDSKFEKGAGYDQVVFKGEGERRELEVGWTVTVKAAPGATVTVTNKAGRQVCSGTADEEGMFSAPVVQYVYSAKGKEVQTPHTIKVESGPKQAEKQVTVDEAMTVEF